MSFYEVVTLLVFLGLPIWATWAIFTSHKHTLTHQLLFLLVTWLVPLIGPVATLVLLRRPVAEER